MKTAINIDKVKPIHFNNDMVKALLSGNKTQTRRLVKDIPNGDFVYDGYSDTDKGRFHFLRYADTPNCGFGGRFHNIGKSKYEKGDILYVKESYSIFENFQDTGKDKIIYQADQDENKFIIRYKTNRFMFKKDARIFLKVKKVRVQRVQKITEKDAIAEGIYPIDNQDPPLYYDFKSSTFGFRYTAKDAYSGLWDSINSKKEGCSWDLNPFCWVYDFEIVEIKN